MHFINRYINLHWPLNQSYVWLQHKNFIHKLPLPNKVIWSQVNLEHQPPLGSKIYTDFGVTDCKFTSLKFFEPSRPFSSRRVCLLPFFCMNNFFWEKRQKFDRWKFQSNGQSIKRFRIKWLPRMFQRNVLEHLNWTSAEMCCGKKVGSVQHIRAVVKQLSCELY